MKRTFILLLTLMCVLGVASKNYAQPERQLFIQAIQSAQEGEHEKAIELFEQVIEVNPNFAPAYNFLGLSYQAFGLDSLEVAWYFKAAVDIDPSYEDALINLGKTYYGLGFFDLAEHHTLKAFEINPGNLEAQLSLGWIYLLGKSNPSQAIHYFRSILKELQHPSAYFGLGMAYFMNAETPRVLECITALREMKHDDLAQQLELIIRDSEYVAQTRKDQPLLESATTQDPLLMPRESRMSISAIPIETQITVTGAMPVRLLGQFDFNSQMPLDGPVPHAKPPAHVPARILTTD